MTATGTETHKRHCLNFALALIAVDNDERGEITSTPETDEFAADWIDEGTVDCHCNEADAWVRLWSS